MGIKNRTRKIFIIIPVHNGVDYTKAMLKSIRSKHELGVLLIDNASTDDTPKLAKEMLSRPGGGFIRMEENLGVSRSWNFGIKCAKKIFKPDHYLILNNDVVLHPETIDELVAEAELGKADLISSKDLSKHFVEPKDIIKYRNVLHKKVREAPDFSCFLLTKKGYKKTGAFDENFFPAYFEDNDYHYRMRLKGLKAIVTTRSVYYHYGSITIKQDRDAKQMVNDNYIRNEHYFELKWGGKPGKEKFTKPFNNRPPEDWSLKCQIH